VLKAIQNPHEKKKESPMENGKENVNSIKNPQKKT
jgi:hypothetical protein